MFLQHHEQDYDYYLRAKDYKDEIGKTTRHFNATTDNENTCRDWIVAKCSIVEKAYFKNFIVALVVINTIQLGVATMDFVTDYDYTCQLFHRIDLLFMTIFTIEIAMQFAHRGRALFDNVWLTSDFVLVALTWVLIMIPNFREFRVLRAFRLILKFKEMRNLVSALVVATKKIFAVAMLLLLIFYTSGVIFTLLFKDLKEDGYTEEDYFSRLDITLFTLFQFMTLDGWSDITKEVLTAYHWAWIPICTFILISSFVVINLFIAVICDSVAEVQRREFEHNIMQINSKLSMVEDNKAAEIFELEYKVEQLQEMIIGLRNDLRQRNDLMLQNHEGTQQNETEQQ